MVRESFRAESDCEREVCVAHAASDSHFLSQPMSDFYVFTSHKYVTWSADSEAFVRRQQSTDSPKRPKIDARVARLVGHLDDTTLEATKTRGHLCAEARGGGD